MLIHFCLCIFYGYFCVIGAELSSCERDRLAYLKHNMFIFQPFKKKCAHPWSNS